MTKYTLASSREWYNNLPGKRASAAMILRYDDTYLMIKDDYKKEMTFPSGVVDPDESAKTTAIRETMEEVGITLTPEMVNFYSVAYISELYGFKDRFHFYFTAEITASEAGSIILSKGIEYHKWALVDEISQLAGGRRAYVYLQKMLETNKHEPYFEV